MTIIIGPNVYGTSASDNLFTQTGPVVGNDADNTVYGFDGSDDIYAKGGNDKAYGGNGNDGIDGGSGNDTLYGEQGNDDLSGGSGTNWLYGGDGNDVMHGTGGNDGFYGGSGFDTVDYSQTGIGAYIDVAGQVGQGGDVVYGIEKFVGSTSTDTMKGDYGSNWFYGVGGSDLLYGGAGNDTMDGGTGNDFLEGGNGADSLIGGDGVDTASYLHSAAGVSVDLTAGTGGGGEATGDKLSSIENVIGSGSYDYLFGNYVANKLDGGAGDDWIDGRGGADSLIGGSGIDTVDYTYSGAGVSVDIQSNSTHYGEAEGDKISGFENIYGTGKADDLYGNASGNWLWGAEGGDYLDGRGGADTLRGMAGKDYLNGGTGADDFKYNHTSESGPGNAVHDVIKDFNHAEGDKIDAADIDAREHTSGNQAFQWINHASFSAEGQVRSYFDGDNTVLEFNSNGSGGAEMEIVLLGHHDLGSGDFVL